METAEAPKVRGRVDQDPFTTVMIRRVPVEMTPDDLVDMINRLVPGKFDFVYMPYDRRKKVNIALAFINLVDSISAMEVCDYINRCNTCRQWTLVACESNVQSLSFNMTYYTARFGFSSIHEPHAPWIFKDGRRVTNSELSDLYRAIPKWVYDEAADFVRAEKAGNSSKGVLRRTRDLVWKPDVFAPKGGAPSADRACSGKTFGCDAAREPRTVAADRRGSSSESTRSSSGSDHIVDRVDHAVRCPPGLHLQEGVVGKLLAQHGALIISC
ncbi:ML3 [Symbiodinium natans]|uniref:ML3 protein n=1 Tax=Symbiodinium natans TaxID=878477 RepID=A0A812ILB3_9DINO|nr:ML3 [Symbiodinium natans]